MYLTNERRKRDLALRVASRTSRFQETARTQRWIATARRNDLARNDADSWQKYSRARNSSTNTRIAICSRFTNVQSMNLSLTRHILTKPYGSRLLAREKLLIWFSCCLSAKKKIIALAAVLRSPLVGISDNALLALRCAPWLKDAETGDPLYHFNNTRRLLTALQRHREIAYIDEAEHELLERAAGFISELVKRRHHYALDDLLRYAVERSEYQTVIAANFDGAQRLANVERLYTLAARFEQSGNYLIRDFVRYVEDFEAIGSRESEGQLDDSANAAADDEHQPRPRFSILLFPSCNVTRACPIIGFCLTAIAG